MGNEIDLLFKTAMDDEINENSSSNSNVMGEYSSPEDLEIAEIAHALRVRIKIIGCGGGGSNTINRMSRIGIDGADLMAINTDAAHLLTIKSKGKLLIGKRRTGGRGTGASPVVGEEAAMEDLPRIQNMVAKNDITFVTCGLGGGTGTGSAPIIAKCAKDAGSLVISVVTLPFSAEGSLRMENALRGLEKVSQYSDTVIAIPNDKLLKEVPKRPIEEAFGYADSVLSEAIKGITELITKTGIINLDYADIKTIMKDGGVAMIGIGTSNSGQDRVLQAVNDAIKSPLVEADISEARNCLIRVIGGPNMTVSEAETAMSEIQKKIDQDARIIWGANVNENMGDEIKVLVLITGVKSPYMISGKTQARNLGKMFSPYSSEEGLEMVS